MRNDFGTRPVAREWHAIESITGYTFDMRALDKELRAIIRASEVKTLNPNEPMYRLSAIDESLFRERRIMQEVTEAMKAQMAQLKEVRKEFETLGNQITALADFIAPAMAKQVKDLRQLRMTTVVEMQLSLTAMRDVRNFFLDHTYDSEMARIERFVKLCREVEQLKASGVFDAMCDSAIKLAIREEAKNG